MDSVIDISKQQRNLRINIRMRWYDLISIKHKSSRHHSWYEYREAGKKFNLFLIFLSTKELGKLVPPNSQFARPKSTLALGILLTSWRGSHIRRMGYLVIEIGYTYTKKYRTESFTRTSNIAFRLRIADWLKEERQALITTRKKRTNSENQMGTQYTQYGVQTRVGAQILMDAVESGVTVTLWVVSDPLNCILR